LVIFIPATDWVTTKVASEWPFPSQRKLIINQQDTYDWLGNGVNGCIQGNSEGIATYTGSEITLPSRRIFVVYQTDISGKRKLFSSVGRYREVSQR